MLRDESAARSGGRSRGGAAPPSRRSRSKTRRREDAKRLSQDRRGRLLLDGLTALTDDVARMDTRRGRNSASPWTSTGSATRTRTIRVATRTPFRSASSTPRGSRTWRSGSRPSRKATAQCSTKRFKDWMTITQNLSCKHAFPNHGSGYGALGCFNARASQANGGVNGSAGPDGGSRSGRFAPRHHPGRRRGRAYESGGFLCQHRIRRRTATRRCRPVRRSTRPCGTCLRSLSRRGCRSCRARNEVSRPLIFADIGGDAATGERMSFPGPARSK